MKDHRKKQEVTNSPTPPPGTSENPSLFEVFGTLRKKELYGNLTIHLFLLIPVAVFLAFLGKVLDRNWGWEPVCPAPWNFIFAFLCFAIGGFVTWYSYCYLYLKGDGSPGAHLGHTKTIVRSGIYAWVRHPSNIGKLIGVIGLGILLQTPGFIFVIIPILFLYSTVTTLLIQEHFCIKNFGQDYIDYKKEVPMFIPKFSKIKKALTGRKGK